MHTAVDHRNEEIILWIDSNVPALRTTTDNVFHRIPLHYAGQQGNTELYKLLNPTKEEEQTQDLLHKIPLELLKKNQGYFNTAQDKLATLKNRVTSLSFFSTKSKIGNKEKEASYS